MLHWAIFFVQLVLQQNCEISCTKNGVYYEVRILKDFSFNWSLINISLPRCFCFSGGKWLGRWMGWFWMTNDSLCDIFIGHFTLFFFKRLIHYWNSPKKKLFETVSSQIVFFVYQCRKSLGKTISLTFSVTKNRQRKITYHHIYWFWFSFINKPRPGNSDIIATERWKDLFCYLRSFLELEIFW